MFKIVRIPPKLKSFFNPLQNQFHFNHFQYFQTLVLLMAFCWGRRNIATLYRHLDSRGQPHRSRFNNFLNVGRCNYQVTLQLKASELLSHLHPAKGQTVELIIDDSKKQKRGKTMQAVGWIRDPLTGQNIRGHQYVTATIRFKGHTIPFGIRFYVKKEDCKCLGVEFKKTTQLAAELISEFKPPEGIRVHVLFDRYYLCPVIVKSCRKSGFHFVSTLKSNRSLFKNGRKLKASKYGKNLFCNRRKSTFAIHKSKGLVKYVYVDAGWRYHNTISLCRSACADAGTAMATLRSITAIRRRYFMRIFLLHNASYGLDEISVLHRRREYQTFAPTATDPDADGLLC